MMFMFTNNIADILIGIVLNIHHLGETGICTMLSSGP